jgi:hypothetical protein
MKENPVVMRMDVRVFEPLFNLIEGEAKKKRVSASRWMALLATERFGLPEEEAVPPLGIPGRPRKNGRTSPGKKRKVK